MRVAAARLHVRCGRSAASARPGCQRERTYRADRRRRHQGRPLTRCTERPTGCTVILVDGDAVGGVSQRGGAPGTRETDLLDPLNMVDKVNADRPRRRQRVRPRRGDRHGALARGAQHRLAGRAVAACRSCRPRSCSISASAETRRSARPPTAATRRPQRRPTAPVPKARSAPAPARPSASSAARAAR